MKNSILRVTAIALCLAATGAIAQDSRIEDFRIDLTPAKVEEAQARNTRALASQAYIWGLPAFLHFRQTTEILQARRAIAPKEEPFGGWVLLRKLATPSDRGNVMPNVDTLYGASYVLLDLQGPIVVSTPEVKDRYYSVALHDAYFNTFDVIGTRTTGGDAADVLVLPPNFEGPAPEGFTRVVRAPTSAIAIFQRLYINNDSELVRVHAIQDAIKLAPLAHWNTPNPSFPRIDAPEFVTRAAVRETRDPLQYFDIINAHTCRNRPPAAFGALVEGFAQAGLGPCARLPVALDLRAALMHGAREAQQTINAQATTGRMRGGWRVPDPNTGKASLDYLGRAVVQITQVASFAPEEAMYFTARLDSRGERLSGVHRYELTFSSGKIPPVDPRAFWSLTMYDARDNLLVANQINRYVVRPATPGLTYGADGSLTIILDHQRPGDAPEGNWLPAPAGEFIVVLRAYMPDTSILTGEWFPPGIERVLQ